METFLQTEDNKSYVFYTREVIESIQNRNLQIQGESRDVGIVQENSTDGQDQP